MTKFFSFSINPITKFLLHAEKRKTTSKRCLSTLVHFDVRTTPDLVSASGGKKV